jgi:nucleoside-diphosphate-sugar epimerase
VTGTGEGVEARVTERILVTGSSGRLGRAVVADLLAAGYAVVGADRAAPDSADRAAPAEGAGGSDFLTWDGADFHPLAEALTGCTGLVHLAAIPTPQNDPAEVVFGNNTTATFAALQAAAEAGVGRAVIASSVSAYGMPWSPQPTRASYVPLDEQHPMRNHDPYGLSKEVDERTAEMFCRRAQMTVAALRFHWIATREEQLARVESLRSDVDWDTQLREMWGYVDVRDAARACRLALEAARDRPFGFLAMNIVAADSLREEPLEWLLATHAPQIQIRRSEQPLTSAFAIERARSVIGWVPQHSWRDAS